METGTPPITPRDALNLLKEGNRRFISGLCQHPHSDHLHLKELGRSGPKPFATVMACSDSRMPVERLFDCGFGDLFVVRTAGHAVDTTVLGSIEFGCTELKTPLLVVLGHTDCLAVSAAATGAELPENISRAIEPIRHNLQSIIGYGHLPDKGGVSEQVLQLNAWGALQQLIAGSNALNTLAQSGALHLEAALCNTATGKVNWLGPPTAVSGSVA